MSMPSYYIFGCPRGWKAEMMMLMMLVVVLVVVVMGEQARLVRLLVTWLVSRAMARSKLLVSVAVVAP